ncbi:MAG: hypothetical protein RL483_365 [Pseudomonadota bacterium]
MQVEPLHAFSDNIIWALLASQGAGAWVVDPGDAQPVVDWLSQTQRRLVGILITHHHQDHVGGVESLLASPALWVDPMFQPVLGPEACRPFGVNQVVSEKTHGQALRLAGLDGTLRVLEVPGHTLDHLAYLVQASGQPASLFCGDTLFAGGCGRLLGGTAAQLQTSLVRLTYLAAETRVYCAHEYTLSNLQFAAEVLPDCPAVRARLAAVELDRQAGRCTLPSTIGLECQTNPFLRETDPEAFAALRKAKDSFRPASR